jgi:hypothetical protein
MQGRTDEPKVGDQVLLKGAKYRILAKIFEENSMVLSRVTNDVRTYALWDPTWEWDDGERLWKATRHRRLEEIE